MDNPRMIYGKELADLIAQMKSYKKTKPILAIQISEPIMLGEGLGGEIKGELVIAAGSWLAHDPENMRVWPIGEHVFSNIYAPCEGDDCINPKVE